MNLITKLLTCLGCCLVFFSFGTTTGVDKVQSPSSSALFEQGFTLINEDVTKADSLIMIAWKIAYSEKDGLGIANGHFYKGCVFDRKMMLDSAIYFLNRSIELYKLEDKWDNVPDAHGRIGLLKFKKNQIQDGLEELITAIKIAEAHNNQASVVRNSIVLAMHHNDNTLKYYEALKYLEKAENGARNLKDKNLLGHVYLQLSHSHRGLNQLDEAQYFSEQSIESFKQINSTYNHMRALFTLGMVYSEKRDAEKIYTILDKVKPMLDKNHDGLMQANYDKLYAEAAFIQGHFKSALSHAQHSAQLLEEGGQTSGVGHLNELIARIYYSLGEVAKGDSLYFSTKAIQDSVFSSRAYQIDSELRQKYNSDVQLNKIELQQLQLKHAYLWRYVLIVSILLLAALAFAFYRRMVVKDRLNKLNELLIKEIHHRVKNNLQLLLSLLNMQTRRLETEEAKDMIDKNIARLKTFSIIHDTLYMQNSIENINMEDFVSQICSGHQKINEDEVQISIQANDIQLTVDMAMPIGLIINELVTNTFKYAFAKSEVEKSFSSYEEVLLAVGESPAKEIQISLTQINARDLEIIYHDTGSGIQTTWDIKNEKSTGMRLIQGLTKQMHGSIDYIKEKNEFLIHLRNK